jgi:hypothetical protein
MCTRRSRRIRRDRTEQTAPWADGRHSGLWRCRWPAAPLHQQAVRCSAGLRRQGVRRGDTRRPGRRPGHISRQARRARLAQWQQPAVAPPVAGPRQDRPDPLAVSGAASQRPQHLRSQDAHVGQRVAGAAPRAHNALQQLWHRQRGWRRGRRGRRGRCAVAQWQLAPWAPAALERPWQGKRPEHHAGRGSAAVRRRAGAVPPRGRASQGRVCGGGQGARSGWWSQA